MNILERAASFFKADTPAVLPSAGETTSTDPMVEIGVTGLKQNSGFLWEEYLPQLRGRQGIRTYQEMSQNDPTIGAVLRALELLIRRVEWDVTAADDTPEAEAEKLFVESIFDDMSHTFGDFISEVLTMLVFGFAYHEIVWKVRAEYGAKDPARRSRYPDGRIGVRKLSPRSQDSLLRWEMQADGGIAGFHQLPLAGGGQFYIPIERSLLFRVSSRKNSPESWSILRNAYRPWYFAKSIEEYEAIGIERELCGVPVVSIPARYLSSDKPADLMVKAAYEKVARDLRFNEQSGLVIPSDAFADADGKVSTMRMVDIKLITSGGQRTIDTDKVVQRHQRAAARSMLADFIMLGEGSGSARGSYGMHEGKADLFMKAGETVLDQIADPLNRFLLPRLWEINGLPPETMPNVSHGAIAEVDAAELGAMLKDLTAAGMPLFPDEDVEDYVREKAGLPQRAVDGTL